MFNPGCSEWHRKQGQDKTLKVLRRVNVILAIIMITLITLKVKQLYDLSNIYTNCQ